MAIETVEEKIRSIPRLDWPPKTWQERLLVVIPAYNEEQSLGHVINQTHAFYPEVSILVVDDGSRDATREVARAHEARVIRLRRNSGIGVAMRVGYRYALRRGYDFVVQVDADGQHDPKFIGRLISPLLTNEADVVIGSRFLQNLGNPCSLARRIGICFFSYLLHFLTGKWTADPTSGNRAMNRKVLELFSKVYPFDYPEPESLMILHQEDLRVKEVPIVMDRRLTGKSSISLGRAVYYMIKVALAILIRSFLKPRPSPCLRTPERAIRKTIPLFKPSYGEEEIEALKQCLFSSWTGLGPRVKEFEERFAKYIGVKYAVATNSCTAGLHLALKVAGIEGKEVITTPLTFISTNHAILYNSGIPVFADVNWRTLNLDPASVEALITERTRALLVMHYGGQACEMDAFLALARRHHLLVVEDAAHACGGEYRGKKLGSFGDLGCFSFHAVKNLSIGDGGMITTNHREYYERLLKLRWLGISKDTWSRASNENGRYSWWYDVEEVGFRYCMNDILASIGLVQLEKLDRLNDRRRQIVARYNEAFRGLDGIETPVEEPYARSAHHNYVIKIERRDALCEYLKDRGISSGVHYIPNHHYSMFRSFRASSAVCDRVWKRLLTLPLYSDLTDEEVDYIIQSVREFRVSP